MQKTITCVIASLALLIGTTAVAADTCNVSENWQKVGASGDRWWCTNSAGKYYVCHVPASVKFGFYTASNEVPSQIVCAGIYKQQH